MRFMYGLHRANRRVVGYGWNSPVLLTRVSICIANTMPTRRLRANTTEDRLRSSVVARPKPMRSEHIQQLRVDATLRNSLQHAVEVGRNRATHNTA